MTESVNTESEKTELEANSESHSTGAQQEGFNLVCNCNEEYRTTLCPVHDVNLSENSGYVQETVLLEDKNILNVKPQIWEGHVFICTKCKGQVMHNMTFCPGCGAKLIIKSKLVTAYINQLSQRIRMR